MNTSWLLRLSFGFFLACGVNDGQLGQADEPKKAEAPDRAKVNALMQRKQQLSHEVFDAIILKDFKRINKNANSLVAVSKAAEFSVHRTPKYVQYSAEFQEAVEKLASNARDKNGEGTTLAFTEMTLSCVRCHEYVRTLKPD